MSRKQPFPSVTICNLKPYVTSKMNKLLAAEPSLGKPLEITGKQAAIHDVSRYALIYAVLGENRATEIGYDFNEMVLDRTCFFTKKEGATTVKVPCDPKNVRLVPNPDYFNCWTINPEPETSAQTLSLEMILYLDTKEALSCDDQVQVGNTSCSSINVRRFSDDRGVGSRAVVHAPDTFPDIRQKGIDVLAGTLTRLNFKIDQEHLYDRPTKHCASEDKYTYYNQRGADFKIRSGKLRRYLSSVSGCKQQQVMTAVYNLCGCYPLECDFPLARGMQAAPYCAVYLKNGTVVTDKVTCSQTAMANETLILKSECLPQCTWSHFATYVQQTKWPAPAKELDFHATYIRNNRLLRKRFAAYDEVYQMLNQSKFAEAKATLKKIGMIHENFIKLKIFRPDFSSLESKEVLLYPLPAVLSQIGGICSLWSGISMIAIVEILELIYYLFTWAVKKNNIQHSGGHSIPTENISSTL